MNHFQPAATMTNSDKHTSLPRYGNNYSRKKFYYTAPQVPQGVAFCAINNLDTKLECLTLGDIYDLL